MNQDEFESLINKSEGTVLDFKSDMYDFQNDKDKKATANFVKDIISMANTVRTQSSYIVFGIRELEFGKLEFLGITRNIDDSILQDKIKDKVFPRPKFSYRTIDYQGKCFGIIEIPIEKYELPITPSINGLKGLEHGKLYYRHGSSNTEATTHEIIRINDWFKSLPTNFSSDTLTLQVSNYIKDITQGKKLSTIISDMLAMSKKHHLPRLQQFCQCELKGVTSNDEDLDYRMQNVLFSLTKISINPNPFIKATPNLIKKEMEENKDFYPIKIVMHHPLIEIESSLDKMENDSNSAFAILKSDTQILLEMEKNYPVYLYLFEDNFTNLYRSIRQKAIDILMEI